MVVEDACRGSSVSDGHVERCSWLGPTGRREPDRSGSPSGARGSPMSVSASWQIRQGASRRDLVTALGSLVAGATSGRPPSTVVLTAPSGAGKTRLVRRLVADIRVPTHQATADLGWLQEPYGVAQWLLGLEFPDPVPADALGLLLTSLDELAALGPRLLVVDDVHRADAATLAFLERVAGSARDLSLGLGDHHADRALQQGKGSPLRRHRRPLHRRRQPARRPPIRLQHQVVALPDRRSDGAHPSLSPSGVLG